MNAEEILSGLGALDEVMVPYIAKVLKDHGIEDIAEASMGSPSSGKLLLIRDSGGNAYRVGLSIIDAVELIREDRPGGRVLYRDTDMDTIM